MSGSPDIEYLLALAEEAQLRREALYRERQRRARIERQAALRARLRAEIQRLMLAPFSWQVRQ